MLVPQQSRAFTSFNLEDATHRIVRDENTFREAIGWLSRQPRVAVDTEGTGLRWYRDARICGVSMSAKLDDSTTMNYYFPSRHTEPGSVQIHPELLFEGCKLVLENERVTKVLHNIKFDEHFFRKEGVRILGPRRDTMIGAHLYDENSPIGLKDRAAIDLHDSRAHVAEALLQREVSRVAKTMKLGKTAFLEMFGYDRLSTSIVGGYGTYDTDFTLRLDDLYIQRNVYTRYAGVFDNEMKLTKVLHDMEQAGLDVDTAYLMQLNQMCRREMDRLTPVIHSLFRFAFDIGSDTQLVRAMQRVGIPLWKTTRGGALAADAEVLEEVTKNTQLHTDIRAAAKLVLQFRSASKIVSTYTSSVLEAIGHDGRVHGDYQQVGTKTGRLSARHPNMQNFQGDSDERAMAYSGAKVEDGGVDPWSVKRAFRMRRHTSTKYARLFLDYSQIELRVLARLSGDPRMSTAFIEGIDLHTQVAQEVFGSSDKAHRRLAKVINFGLSYCMSAAGFARQTDVPIEEAERHFEVFFEKYARLGPFREELWSEARRQGCYFENPFGRPRRVPLLNSHDGFEKGRAERMAIGALIQGTAAQLTKESLVRVWEWEQEAKTGLIPVQTIHDEISLDVPVPHFAEVTRAVTSMMCDFPFFNPIPIEVGVEFSTTTWADKEELPHAFYQLEAAA